MIGVTGIIGAVGVSGAMGIVSGSSGGTPPPSEGLTVGVFDAGQNIYGYSDGSGLPAFGDLNPKQFFNTGVDLKSVVYQFNGGDEYVLVLSETPDVGDIDVTIGAFSVPCSYDPFDDDDDIYIGVINGQAALNLLNYLQVNTGQTVPYTIEEAVIPSVGFTVGRYVDPPSGSVFYGFYRGNDTPNYGDLQPREFLSTGVDMTAISFYPNGFGTYACLIEFPDGSPNVDSGDIVVTVGEVEVTCIYDEDEWIDESVNIYLGALPLAESQALVAYFDANENQTVPYTIEEAAPQGNLTFGDTTPLTGFASKGYAGASFPTQVGSLSPDVLLNGTRLDGIYTPRTGDPGSNEIAILAQAGQPNDFGDSSINYNLTFDGVVYLFTFDGSNYSINSAVLKQFIEDKAASGDAIVFTAEEAATVL